MTILRSTTGKTGVNITGNNEKGFKAFFINVYSDGDQVLSSKSFKTESGAIKWAKSKLI